jgi:hypothetical protein
MAVGYGFFNYLMAGKKFFSTYKIKFLDSKFDSAETIRSGFTNIFFKIKIQVENKTDFVGKLNSANAALYYGTKKIAIVDAKNSIGIQAQKNTIVEIPIVVATINLVNSIPVIINAISEGKALKFHVKGIMHFSAGDYEFNQDINVPLK